MTRIRPLYTLAVCPHMQKTGEEVYKTLSKAAIKEYVGLGIERMLVIEKGD